MSACIRLTIIFLSCVLLAACANTRNTISTTYHHYDRTHERSYHIVSAGDTLYSISFPLELDYEQLAEWNDIQPPYTIHAGQKLRLTPPPATSKPRTSKNKSKAAKNVVADKPKAGSKGKVSTAAPKKVASKPTRNRWSWPTKGKVIRTYSAKGTNSKGISIRGKEGQAILAASSGKVVYSGNGLLGYGNLIIVEHGGQFLSAYAHNRQLLVAEGGYVKRGQKIAELGKSETQRPKLYFEIRHKGKPVDPLRYLPKR